MHTLLQAAPADLATRSVFISYSRADLGPVRAMALALRRSGLRTWMDLDDLRPGRLHRRCAEFDQPEVSLRAVYPARGDACDGGSRVAR